MGGSSRFEHRLGVGGGRDERMEDWKELSEGEEADVRRRGEGIEIGQKYAPTALAHILSAHIFGRRQL